VLMPDKFDNATHAVAQPPCLTKPILSNCTNQPTPMDIYGAVIRLLANNTPPSYSAFINRLWHWQGPRPPPGVDGDMLWPGKIDVELASSRDGITFQRSPGSPHRQPLLGLGREGHWASAFKWALPNPIYYGDSEFLFYAGRNFNHNLETQHGIETPATFRSGIACVVWRKDGMLALEPAGSTIEDGYTGAREATTVPLQFAHGLRQLVLNLDTGAGGSCLVEIQDASTRAPQTGFSLSEAVPLVANAVIVRPTWANRSSIEHLGGKDLRLRFVLQGAKLYSFGFV
jgi:hypothetical protein